MLKQLEKYGGLKMANRADLRQSTGELYRAANL